MKKLLAATFVALLMVGCGESSQLSEGVDMTGTAPKKDALETAVDWSKLQDRSGVKYLPNEDTPFTGRAESFYENGQKRSENNYKDGIYDGVSTDWYENGQKQREINFKDRKQDGLWTYWYENGQKLEEVNYEDGKPNGLITRWYEKGQKKEEGNLKDGKYDGLRTWWYENGQKKEERNLKDRVSTDWYENGQKQRERSFKDGKLISTFVWKPNGENCPVTQIDEDGNGVVVWYNDDGKKKEKINFKNGKEDGLQESWYANGQKGQESSYKDGKLMSVVAWKPNGEKCPVTNMKHGNGIVIWYNEDGKGRSRATFRGGEAVDFQTVPKE
jgi:antitoxin component YwqK of YwqJK toxin-antitoxin module